MNFNCYKFCLSLIKFCEFNLLFLFQVICKIIAEGTHLLKHKAEVCCFCLSVKAYKNVQFVF